MQRITERTSLVMQYRAGQTEDETGKTDWCCEMSLGNEACSVRVLNGSVHYNSNRKQWRNIGTKWRAWREPVRGLALMPRTALDSTLSRYVDGLSLPLSVDPIWAEVISRIISKPRITSGQRRGCVTWCMFRYCTLASVFIRQFPGDGP